jgi:hypothetical protein
MAKQSSALKRLERSRWLLLGLLVVSLLACVGKPPVPPVPPAPPPPPPPSTDPGPPTQLPQGLPNQGLSDEEVRTFFHLAEGSELLPTSWLKALEQKDSATLFLENVERFGLLPDEKDPGRLPIGLSSEPSLDTRWANIRMSGINCAACHVGEFASGGSKVRVIGAPNKFDVEVFFEALYDAGTETITHPRKLYRFVKRLLRAPDDAFAAKVGSDSLSLFMTPYEGLEELSAASELEREVTERLEELVAEEQAVEAADLRDGLMVAKSPGAPTRLERDVALAALDKQLQLKQPVALGAELSAALARENFAALEPRRLTRQRKRLRLVEFFGEVRRVIRLFKARLKFVRNLHAFFEQGRNKTKPMLGRVDAFGDTRNLLFPKDQVLANAPVSYPHLWGIGNLAWLHWDGNTNSMLERNMGQAIGLGAVSDSSGLSTLLPRNIAKLESIAQKLHAPHWPEEVFGPIDIERAKAGKQLFQTNCRPCHDNPAGRDDIPDVGTDPGRRASFGATLPSSGQRFSDALATKLALLKTKSYEIFGILPAEANQIEQGRIPAIWRSPRPAYVSRPLIGIWATAPYLHNGSVASLFDLLSPEREAFRVGTSREYDCAKLGYAANGRADGQVFDVTLAGNGNQGHPYTFAKVDERYAVIEYLKTLTTEHPE